MPRVCVNHPDNFCYICGQLTIKSQRRNLTPLVKNCYFNYFGFAVRNLDKTWTPSVCCAQCNIMGIKLTSWAKGSRHMPFIVPMIWSEQKDHVSDCYFCQISIKGINHKSRHTVNYPNLQPAQRLIPHSNDLPVPQPLVNSDEVIDEENLSENSDSFNLLSAYKNIGCNMSLKIHFLHSHLDYLKIWEPLVMNKASDSIRILFNMEKRYQGKWSPNMLADYCWTLKRDVLDAKYSRKS